MPETFGTGTASSSYHGRSAPTQFWQTVVPAGGQSSFRFTPDSSFPVVLAIDVVTGGGSSGNPTCLFASSDVSHPFWSINVGSNTDTFSWRGWLVLPEGEIVFITNNSSNFVAAVWSGLVFPTRTWP